MVAHLYSAFRTEFFQLWKEYRFRRQLKSSDSKYWSKSLFTQKLRMVFLNIFRLKRLSDQELLEKLGFVEHSIRNDTRVKLNLQYYTTVSNQYKELKEEFELRLLGKSSHISIDMAIKHAKIKL